MEDAKVDINLLRDNLSTAGKTIRRQSSETEAETTKSSLTSREARELQVAKMEELQMKHNSLKLDLRRLLDEKEDIVREKEDMKIKVTKSI